MRIFFLREIAEIKKQGEGAGYFIQVGTPRGGWSAEAENEKGKCGNRKWDVLDCRKSLVRFLPGARSRTSISPWAVPPAVPQTTVQCTPAAAHCAVDALACTRPPPRAALPSYSYAPASPFECPTRAVLGAAASRAERPSVSQHRLYVGIAYYIGVK